MVNKQLKGACIGAGYFGQFHYDAWARIEEVHIEAICDADIEKAKSTAQKWGIPQYFTDPAEMLEKVKPDFVDIITPPSTHFNLIKLVANYASTIICQKPLAPSFEEAKEIIDYTTERNVQFAVHENWRFQPWYRQIKSMLEQGEIGELFSIYSKMRMGDGWQEDAYMGRQPYFRTMPRLLVFETGIHFIDTFRFLAGEVESVYAQLRKLNKVIEGEDAGLINFNFQSGAMGVFDGNRYNESPYEDSRYTFGDFAIDGSEGTIRLDGEGNITVQKLGQATMKVEYQHERKGFAGDCVYFTNQHFTQAMLGNEAFETLGTDYLNNLKVQEAIYTSAQNNAVVTL